MCKETNLTEFGNFVLYITIFGDTLNSTKRKGGEEMHREYLPEGLIKPGFARLYNIGCFKSVFRGLLSYHKRLYQLEGTEGSDTDRIYTDALETALELFDKEEKRLKEKLGNDNQGS